MIKNVLTALIIISALIIHANVTLPYFGQVFKGLIYFNLCLSCLICLK